MNTIQPVLKQIFERCASQEDIKPELYKARKNWGARKLMTFEDFEKAIYEFSHLKLKNDVDFFVKNATTGSKTIQK